MINVNISISYLLYPNVDNMGISGIMMKEICII